MLRGPFGLFTICSAGVATSTDIIRQALGEGFARGLISRKEIEALPDKFPKEKHISKGLTRKGRG
jgi:hypothetical protein